MQIANCKLRVESSPPAVGDRRRTPIWTAVWVVLLAWQLYSIWRLPLGRELILVGGATLALTVLAALLATYFALRQRKPRR
jgi:hypothetical protein